MALGMDIGAGYTEIYRYDTEKKDALPFGGNERYVNDLFHRTSDGAWFAGYEAEDGYMSSPGDSFKDIVPSLSKRSVSIIDGKEYDSIDLFIIWIRTLLKLVMKDQDTFIRKLIITSEYADLHMQEAADRLNNEAFAGEKICEVISHNTASLFYLFNQDSDIWSDGTVLFTYDEKGMRCDRVTINRYDRPVIVTMKNQVIDGMADVNEDDEKKDQAFLAVIRKVFEKEDVRGVYLLGSGYQGEWMNQSARLLCSGRRAFVGQNLYVKGACFAAFSGSGSISTDGSTVVISRDTVPYDIGINVDYKGRSAVTPIVLGDREWFSTSGSVDVFLDDTNRIQIDMYPRFSKEVIREIIEINGLPKRPPKTTKLSISLRYLAPGKGEITIRDRGFGTMYPTTGKVYKKQFFLPEIM